MNSSVNQGSKSYNSISVIGAGAWGTAIAATLSKNQNEIGLWAKEPEVVKSINERNENNVAVIDGFLVDKKVDALFFVVDKFGTDARSITRTLENIKDPEQIDKA